MSKLRTTWKKAAWMYGSHEFTEMEAAITEAEAEIADLKHDIERYVAMNSDLVTDVERLTRERDEARAEAKMAREKALDEAEKTLPFNFEKSLIRALKTQPASDEMVDTLESFSSNGHIAALIARIRQAEARIKVMDEALAYIAVPVSVEAGTDAEMYQRWRALAVNLIDNARAARKVPT